MAELGFDVIGVDVDEDKIKRLAAGEVPFYEPGLPELLTKHSGGGKLRFTTSYEEAAEFADVHFICVGTPQLPGQLAADVSQVEAAFHALAPHLTRKALVVGKSTVPTGTAVRMEALLAELAPCKDVELAWSPEFLREGFGVQDTLRPDRLVFGLHSAWAEQQLRVAFGPIIAAGTPVVVTDFATAELVKVSANSFLATKISFINAMAEVCETVGADVTALAAAIGLDERIGKHFLRSGLGFGGGCLPKDIRAFMARAEELGVAEALSFLREVDEINRRRRVRAIDLGGELLGGPYPGARIAVLGAAFKPDSDDIRDSPSLDVAATLGSQGADVVIYDPKAMDNARRAHPELGYAATLEEALAGAELTMLLTEWREFVAMDPEAVGGLVAKRNIVDARNVLDAAAWRAAGWQLRALGRP